ncbi:pilus assembly protein [Salmonella enterica subsp. enterica serovar Infantis]|nr:pilus assembly protein [Salmonella enterica subsp. enterica serovar Infantis]
MKTISLRDIRKRFMAQPEKYLNLKKQRGMTLLEIIIVLGIIGTIAAGVVILAQRAYDSKAISDLVTNTNTIRTAVKQVYGPTGTYPAATGANGDAAVLALNDATIATDTATTIGQLVGLGKLSPSEARNNISGDFYVIGGGSIGTTGGGGGGTATPVGKGYFVNINGLDQQQCRNVLLQIGNQWDYVKVINGEDAGRYATPTTVDLAETVVASTGTPTAGDAVLRSLAATTTPETNGNQPITPERALAACANNAGNGVLLGSR